MTWRKGFAEWADGDVAYLSVPFTWELSAAYQRAVWFAMQGYRVRAGGPAVSLMPSYMAEIAQVGGEIDALPHHNSQATFTSRGCIRRCPFCAVPRIEGQLRELRNWEPRPIVCDNNLLACSRAHFDRVIDKLRFVPGIDFNQGLDARLLTPYHAERLAGLDCLVRLAWDNIAYESAFMQAYERLRAAGFAKRAIRVYVLIGYDDTPEDARYRLETVWSLGVRPNPMRYNPLDALKRDAYVAPGWTDRLLRRYMRYWANLRYTAGVPFDDWLGGGKEAGVDRIRFDMGGKMMSILPYNSYADALRDGCDSDGAWHVFCSDCAYIEDAMRELVWAARAAYHDLVCSQHEQGYDTVPELRKALALFADVPDKQQTRRR